MQLSKLSKKFTLSGSALAITMNTFAISEFDIHIFVPFIINLLPTFLAVVFNAKASDPELGSDKQ